MQRLKVSFGFCAVICIMAWLNMSFCLRFLLCAFCHEMGHLIAMRLCHVPVDRIDLTAGGARIKGEFIDGREELICAAAGPVMGILLGLLLLRLSPRTAVVSLLLSAVNLLPVYPMDGGRILHVLLSFFMEEAKTWAILRVVKILVCCLLMLLATWGTVYFQMGIWPIFATLVLLWRVGE